MLKNSVRQSGNRAKATPNHGAFSGRGSDKEHSSDTASSLTPLPWTGSNLVAAEAGHDLNNALGSIRLYLGLLETESSDAVKVRHYLQQIKPAVEHAAELTRQILGLEATRLPVAAISLNSVLESMGPMLSTLPRSDVAVRLRLSPSLSPVAIDRAHVIRIVLNLVFNACDAMPQGGEVLIETANWRVEGQPAKLRSGAKLELAAGPVSHPPGFGTEDESTGWVMLRVRDTGKGMSEATRAQAFQPFFSSKSPAQGTAKLAGSPRSEAAGLGLPSVLRMVENAGGSIQVESVAGKGTDITMLFPGGVRNRPPQDRQQRKKLASNQVPPGSEDSRLWNNSCGWERV